MELATLTTDPKNQNVLDTARGVGNRLTVAQVAYYEVQRLRPESGTTLAFARQGLGHDLNVKHRHRLDQARKNLTEKCQGLGVALPSTVVDGLIHGDEDEQIAIINAIYLGVLEDC